MSSEPSRVERTSTLMRAGGVFSAGIALLLIALSVVLIAVLASRGAFEDHPEDRTPTFSTTASGSAAVPATSATTTVQLEGCAPGPGGALQAANQSLAGMTTVWRDLDIPESNIARGNVATNERPLTRTRTQWCTDLAVVVTVDDLDLVDEVLTGLARNPEGIRGIQGPSFDYDPAKLEEQAFDEAMRVARQKADDAAKRAGSKVTGVVSIREGGVDVDRPADNDSMMLEAGAAREAAPAVKSYTTAVSRNSGEATATARVDVVFRLEE